MGAAYSFSGELFTTAVDASWVFVLLPTGAADEIAESIPRRSGFGSVRVVCRIGSTEWNTSIFPSKEFGSYLLPVKRSVREREKIDRGDTAEVHIRIVDG